MLKSHYVCCNLLVEEYRPKHKAGAFVIKRRLTNTDQLLLYSNADKLLHMPLSLIHI